VKVLIGKKVSMTQRFGEHNAVPVTIVQAGPCTVTQVKGDSDGYRAVQLGFERARKVSKPLSGHFKNIGLFKHLREFRFESTAERGQVISVKTFKVGDMVQVSGLTKGKGFQGVVKRHKFSGSPKTHGHKDQLRMPGSIGSTEPKHVFKGTRMAGRMGGGKATVKNLEIIDIDTEKNLLFIKGAVPGPRNTILTIAGDGDLVIEAPQTETPKSAAPEPAAVAENTPAEKQDEVTNAPAAEKQDQKPGEEKKA